MSYHFVRVRFVTNEDGRHAIYWMQIKSAGVLEAARRITDFSSGYSVACGLKCVIDAIQTFILPDMCVFDIDDHVDMSKLHSTLNRIRNL
jgi:hypothetical protein